MWRGTGLSVLWSLWVAFSSSTAAMELSGNLTAPLGHQWADVKAFVSSAVLQPDMGVLQMVGNIVEEENGNSEVKCWVALIDLKTKPSPTLLQQQLRKATCHDIALEYGSQDGSDNNGLNSQKGEVWVVGGSSEQGTLFGGVVGVDYGFAVQLGWEVSIVGEIDDDENGNNQPNTTNGGSNQGVVEDDDDENTNNSTRRFLRSSLSHVTRNLNGTSTDDNTTTTHPTFTMQGNVAYQGAILVAQGMQTHTVATVANSKHIFTVAMENKIDPDTLDDDSGIRPSKVLPAEFVNLGNPTLKALEGAIQSPLIVTSFKKKDYNASISDPFQNRGEKQWSHEITAPQDGVILHSAGILLLQEDILLVGGTTRHQDGKTQGILTKIDRSLSQGDGTEESVMSVGSMPISSQNYTDDFVYNMCASPDRRYVYLVGSTRGSFVNDGLSGKNDGIEVTEAFLLRINATTLETIDAVQMGTVEGTMAAALDCAVTDDGKHVFVAGNVQDGLLRDAIPQGRGNATDVFVARISDVDGKLSLNWIRQIGGPHHDVLAPRGGLALTPNNDIVLVGNTQGALYNDKSDTASVQVFVTVLTYHGHLPGETELPNKDDDDGTSPDNPTNVTDSDDGTQGPTMAPSPDFSDYTPPPGWTPPSKPAYQSADFFDVTLRIEGIGAITEDEAGLFARATEDFYSFAYFGRRHRHLQDEVSVSNFETSISVTGQKTDSGGNTITYFQSVSLLADQDDLTEEDFKKILVRPFTEESDVENYVKLLQSKEGVFLEATGSDYPRFQGDEPRSIPSSDDGGGLDVMLFVYIGAGVLLCCLCGCYYMMRRRKQPLLDDQDNDFDPEKDMYDRPEQPRQETFDDDYNNNEELAHEERIGNTSGMDFMGNGIDDMSGGSGPTSGFGKDFDHPEKHRSNRRNEDDGDDELDGESGSGSDEDSSGDEDELDSGSEEDEDDDDDDDDDESSSEGERFA